MTIPQSGNFSEIKQFHILYFFIQEEYYGDKIIFCYMRICYYHQTVQQTDMTSINIVMAVHWSGHLEWPDQ